ncbi:MAG: reverse transcriptase family protein, partial [Metallibacterium scheffleri]
WKNRMTTAKRKKPPWLERPIKQYTLDQCALYGVKGLGQLLHVLNWRSTKEALEALPAHRGAYKVWEDAGRRIEAASPELRRVQVRVADLLRRVIPPDYRHSGVRGRSFLTNAKRHCADAPSIKTDIKHFYTSMTFDHVRRFFQGPMKCAPDVASLLANICCFKRQHVPTGGVHSEVLSFYCVKDCFDAIAARVESRGGVLSVYVDDIMITMPGASHGDLHWLRYLFARHGIEIHGADKSRVYRKRETKAITGVHIRNSELRAPQTQHLAIRDGLAKLRDAELTEPERMHAARSVMGHLDHVQQIDPRFARRATGNRARLATIVRVTSYEQNRRSR